MNWDKISYILFRNSVVIRFLKSTKRIVIPGFDHMPLYDVASFFFKGIWKGAITTRASALSFTFFLALFPTIIFFFTLIPYIPIEGFQDTLLALFKSILPKDTYSAAIGTLEDIIKIEHGNLLSIGILASLYFSTNGVSAIMLAFNNSIHVNETRSYIKQKIIALLLVLILSTLIIIAITLIITGSWFLKYLLNNHYIESEFTFYALTIIKWIIVCSLFFFIVSFLYYLAPAKRERFRFISAGSTLATLLFILSSVGFNFYISNFSQYNKLYGSIGTLIIILMWIYIISIVLLIGFELNASIKNAGKQTKKM